MEFDCEGVRRLLGKVQAGGGLDGTQCSRHRAAPQPTPLPSTLFFLFCFVVLTHPLILLPKLAWKTRQSSCFSLTELGSQAGGATPLPNPPPQ